MALPSLRARLGAAVDSDTLVKILAYIIGAAGVYAAIRADLAVLHERVNASLALGQSAHVRLNKIQGID